MLTQICFRLEDASVSIDAAWHQESRLEPGILEQAMLMVQRFFKVVREAPETFSNGLIRAVHALERAIERLGATLEDLGTSRRLVFKEAYQLAMAKA